MTVSRPYTGSSGYFRIGTHAHAWCQISSYLQSAAAQGYNSLIATQTAFAGNAADLIDANCPKAKSRTSKSRRVVTLDG